MKKIVFVTTLTTMLAACSLLPSKTVSGTYQGTLPCADCEKIEAELILNKDNTYQYNTVYYKNKEKHPFHEKGRYTWDPNKSNVIRLTNSGNMAAQVSDKYVEFCDASGNTVKSSHNYKLQKVAP